MQISVEKAANFVKDDPDGPKKFVIGCVNLLFCFLFLPVLSAMGYALEATRESSEGEEKKMPEWSRWAEFMARGFWLFLIGAIILSVPIALNIYGTIKIGVAAVGTARADAALNGSEVTSMGPLLVKISQVLQLVLSFLLPAAFLRYGRTLKFADGLALGGVIEDIKKSPIEYTIIWAIPVITFFVGNLLYQLQLPLNLGLLIAVVPCFFAMILSSKLMGQYYRAYLTDNP